MLSMNISLFRYEFWTNLFSVPLKVTSSHPSGLMADVFSIAGRGTVVTGRVERGTLKKGTDVEIVGINDVPLKTTVTGVEMFKKELDQAMAGDNLGLLLRGLRRDQLHRGMVVAVPGTV